MGRAPCCEKIGLKKGPWTAEEDLILMAYIRKNGHGNWRALPKKAGLLRCGKSCRLRWVNYLQPDIKRGNFTSEEEQTIIKLHGLLGNKWSKIAAELPGRTDNEIKNVWNTHLKKRLILPKETKDFPLRLESKATSSSSISSSESTLSSLNQCEATQDANNVQDAANQLHLDVESVCILPDELNETENKEWPGIYPIDTSVEQNSDFDWKMMDEIPNYDQPFRDFNDYSTNQHQEAKPTLTYSSSFSSCTTVNSTLACSNTSSSSCLGQVDVMSSDHEVFTFPNESNVDDFWGMFGSDLGTCTSMMDHDQKYEQQHTQQNLIAEESNGAGELWLEKLENELELRDANGYEHNQLYLTKDPENIDQVLGSSNLSYDLGVLEFEIDPVLAYFQSQFYYNSPTDQF